MGYTLETKVLGADAVFEGGGVKGIGLVGAVAVAEEKGYRWENVAGASAEKFFQTWDFEHYVSECRGLSSGHRKRGTELNDLRRRRCLGDGRSCPEASLSAAVADYQPPAITSQV